MLEAGEVGAIFSIVDEASVVLARIADRFEALDKVIKQTKEALATFRLPPGINAQLTRLNDRLAALPASADKAAAGVTKAFDALSGSADTAVGGVSAAFGRIDASVSATQDRVLTLKKEMEGLGRMPVATPLAFAGGGGGRGPGAYGPDGARLPGGESRGPGLRLRQREGIPLGGGWHIHSPSMAALGAIGAGLYSIYDAAKVQYDIDVAMQTGQLHLDQGQDQTAAFKQMWGTIKDVSSTTGFGPRDVAEALIKGERFFGGMTFDKRMALEKELLPKAAAEARRKETGLGESFEAMIGAAHQAGIYEPEELAPMMAKFLYLSTITPASLPRFLNALSYTAKMGAELGMPIESRMFMTSMMQTAGITNSKSGTWLRSFWERAYAPMGESHGDMKKVYALMDMGLIASEKDRRPLWEVRDAQGQIDWDKSIMKTAGIIQNYMATHTNQERIQDLGDAFGERGGGWGALMNLPQFVEQFPVIMKKMGAALGGEEGNKELLDASTLVKAQTAWAKTQLILIQIGNVVLPVVNAGLDTLSLALDGIGKAASWIGAFLEAHPSWFPNYGGGGGSLDDGHLHSFSRHGGWSGPHQRYSSAGVGSGNLTALIDKVSAEAGIDSSIMEGIRAGESGHGSIYDTNFSGGDESYGPFQLNRKHPGDLGSIFERDTGLDLSDPKTIPAQAKWVAQYLKRTGDTSPWMGYHGPSDANPNWGDAGYIPPSITAPVPGFPASKGQAALNRMREGPGAEPPIRRAYKQGDDGYYPMDPGIAAQMHRPVHVSLYLDGRKLAENGARHHIRANRTAGNSGYFDSTALPAPTDASYIPG